MERNRFIIACDAVRLRGSVVLQESPLPRLCLYSTIFECELTSQITRSIEI